MNSTCILAESTTAAVAAAQSLNQLHAPEVTVKFPPTKKKGAVAQLLSNSSRQMEPQEAVMHYLNNCPDFVIRLTTKRIRLDSKPST